MSSEKVLGLLLRAASKSEEPNRGGQTNQNPDNTSVFTTAMPSSIRPNFWPSDEGKKKSRPDMSSSMFEAWKKGKNPSYAPGLISPKEENTQHQPQRVLPERERWADKAHGDNISSSGTKLFFDMATSLLDDTTAVETADALSPQPKNSQFCAFCLSAPVEPIALPCTHITCSTCIPRASNPVTCPVCHAEHTLSHRPYKRSSESPSSSSISTLAPIAVIDDPCGRCGQREATSVCLECKTGYCAMCNGIVHVGVLASHIVEDIAGEAQGGRCRRHAGHSLDFYDKDEGVLLCIVCLQNEHQHRGNECVSVAEAAQDARSELSDALGYTAGFLGTLQGHVRKLRESVESIDMMREGSVKAVEDGFSEWRRAIDEKEEEMKAHVEDFYMAQRTASEHELGKQLALLSTFNANAAKMQSLLSDSSRPQSTVISRRLLNLTELLSLSRHVLYLPPISRVAVSVTQPTALSEIPPLAPIPVQPKQVYTYTNDHPLPMWAEQE